jgi:hypothetical protein
MHAKKTIKDAKNLGVARGGKCLSNIYREAHKKLKWCCGRGHTWFARYSSINYGSWCPECSGICLKTIFDCRALGVSRDGKCLSKKYINNHSKLKWQCKQKHIWWATYSSVKNGTWCPHPDCDTTRYNIECARALAETRVGKCLTTIYVNSSSKMNWECVKGHKWTARYTDIQQGKWCPHPDCDTTKNTIEDCQIMAAERGGKCLSLQYTNCYSKLEWKCNKGHTWHAVYSHIKEGTWCPYCKHSHSEAELKIFEFVKNLYSGGGIR